MGFGDERVWEGLGEGVRGIGDDVRKRESVINEYNKNGLESNMHTTPPCEFNVKLHIKTKNHNSKSNGAG
jgi:hypothetical protein